MEWAMMAADFITSLASALAWPVCVALVAWWLRTPIIEVIKRIAGAEMEAGPIKGKLTLSRQVESESVKMLSASEITLSSNPAVDGASDVTRLIQEFERDVSNIDEGRRIPFLVRRLAEWRVLAGFEWINNLIFGSQIDALRALAERDNVTRAEALEYFDTNVKPKFPETHGDAGFDLWAAYLFRNELMRISGDQIAITDRGRAFLKFLAVAHHNETKPL